MKCHIQEKPFNCHECNKKFITKASLLTHHETHKVHKRYDCVFCGITFARKSQLHAHILNKIGERSYNCTICQQDFTTADYLRQHLTVHQVGVFKCQICKQVCKRLSGLQRPMRRKHSKTNY